MTTSPPDIGVLLTSPLFNGAIRKAGGFFLKSDIVVYKILRFLQNHAYLQPKNYKKRTREAELI